MITARQIKARFSKRHLEKIVKGMLAIPFKSNGKKIAHYELQAGVSVQEIVESIKCRVDDVHELYDDGSQCHYINPVILLTINGVTREIKERIRVYQADDAKYAGNVYAPFTKKDVEFVDSFIFRTLMSTSRWIKDNSAIPIFI